MKVDVLLWLSFIRGLKFISLCFKLIIIHFYPSKKGNKFKPRIKLNHNKHRKFPPEKNVLISIYPLVWEKYNRTA